jgi:hypothetical protein
MESKDQTTMGGDLERLYEEEKKASAGKDTKITQLIRQIEDMKTKEAERETAVGGTAEQVLAIAEKVGELRALEEGLKQREAALNFAVEKKISIPMALGNASRLDAFKQEVEGLYEDIRGGLDAIDRKSGGKRETRDYFLKGKTAIDLAEYGRMSKKDRAGLPRSILDRLQKLAEE